MKVQHRLFRFIQVWITRTRVYPVPRMELLVLRRQQMVRDLVYIIIMRWFFCELVYHFSWCSLLP
jgi:hypothetical protein